MLFRNSGEGDADADGESDADGDADADGAVSYTHLTLPTNREV